MPRDRLGRVFALQQMVVHGMGALGLALAGWLLTVLEPGPRLVLAGGFMVAVAAGAAGLRVRPRPAANAPGI